MLNQGLHYSSQRAEILNLGCTLKQDCVRHEKSKTVFFSFFEVDVSDWRKGVEVTPENSFVFFISEFVRFRSILAFLNYFSFLMSIA